MSGKVNELLFHFRGKRNISILKVKVMFKFFSLIDILKMQKTVISLPLISYQSNFRWAFSSQRISASHRKILSKVGPSAELIITPSCAYNIGYQIK